MSEYKMDYCHHDNVMAENRQEYIKREDAIKANENYVPYQRLGEDRQLYMDRILKELPSADVKLIRHGHWEQDGYHVRCSECGTYFCITDREGDSFPINYCPCCGAKMDGEER